MTKSFIAAVLSLCFSAAPPLHADITVSAAISLKAALEKAKPTLEAAAGDKITFNFGGSGTLAGQIHQGAAVDLFISADRPTLVKLVGTKEIDEPSVAVIAGNTLVLAVPADSTTPIASFSDLAKDALHKLAIGDPKVVPAGSYAKETLTTLKLWDGLEKSGKLVTTENVAQVVALVSRGEVDAGIIYSTDAASAKNVKVVASADPKLHAPIEYVSGIVTASKNKDAAARLQKALSAEESQKILASFGFTPPPAPRKE